MVMRPKVVLKRVKDYVYGFVIVMLWLRDLRLCLKVRIMFMVVTHWEPISK